MKTFFAFAVAEVVSASACQDAPQWADKQGNPCGHYNTEQKCSDYGHREHSVDAQTSANVACCSCKELGFTCQDTFGWTGAKGTCDSYQGQECDADALKNCCFCKRQQTTAAPTEAPSTATPTEAPSTATPTEAATESPTTQTANCEGADTLVGIFEPKCGRKWFGNDPSTVDDLIYPADTCLEGGSLPGRSGTYWWSFTCTADSWTISRFQDPKCNTKEGEPFCGETCQHIAGPKGDGKTSAKDTSLKMIGCKTMKCSSPTSCCGELPKKTYEGGHSTVKGLGGCNLDQTSNSTDSAASAGLACAAMFGAILPFA